MDPVPAHLRTWTTWVRGTSSASRHFVAYWISGILNPTTWEISSSMIAIGLSWRQVLCAISMAHIIIAAVIVLNGTMGAHCHVTFPVIVRASFGFWASYFCVVVRIAMSIFWCGLQTFVGSECTYQMLKAIWPLIARVPNHLPESAGITTIRMVCFILYWLVQLPFLLISPQNLRHLFVAKALLVPATFLAMLIRAMVRAPPHLSLARSSVSAGHASTWIWLGALNSAIAPWSTLSVNIPDFTRYAINARAQYIQLLLIPAFVTLIGFSRLYGSVIWDPLQIIDRWESRAAILGTNISANSVGCANDMTVLMPRYINIRRGQIICAVFAAWIVCPWKIIASAPGFLAFMTGSSIFLGPFAAMFYWVIHKCNIDLDALAAAAFLLGFLPNVPGLAASVNSKLQVNGFDKLYDLAWIYGFFSSSLAYWTLSTLFPASETFVDKESKKG
ncbi:cytosine-purine permease [Mycena olivaceomarginata]|nr:cytosine-purine permease [Mycena olivaceomarginata]